MVQRINRRRQKILNKITYSSLAELFGVSKVSVQNWVKQGKLNPANLKDIIHKYNNQYLLDKRRKENATPPPQPPPVLIWGEISNLGK